MKRAGNLYEQIYDYNNLCIAFYKAARGKRYTRPALHFQKNLHKNLQQLQTELINENVPVGQYHFFTIHDPKERRICATPFRERVLQHAIMNIAEPIFEAYQIFDSYVCRKKKGTKAAIERAMSFAKQYKKVPYFLKLDIRKYFDSISHDKLFFLLQRKFKDKKLLLLFQKIIFSYEKKKNYGIPIGNLTSQFFANFYLAYFDHFVKETLCIKLYIRYMDDSIFLFDSKQSLKQGFLQAKHFLSHHLDLNLKESTSDKVENGIPFLGYLIKPYSIQMLAKKKKRFLASLAQYNYNLKTGLWSEAKTANHVTALFGTNVAWFG